jgi:hypothetical protein
MAAWNTPISVAAAGLNPDIGGGFGYAPGLYIVTIIEGRIEASKQPGKSPNLELDVQITQALGEGASAIGAKDTLYVSTDQSDEFAKRNQKALALSVGYSEAEVEQPQFQLLPNRIVGQQAVVFAQRNGVSEKGYPQVNRNFVTRVRFAKLQAEIKAAGGKVPMGPLGEHGRKDGGTGAASNVPGIPAGGAPNFGTPAPVGFGAPQAGAPQAAPAGFAPAPTPNGAPAPFAPPALDAMGGGTLKM